MSVARLAQAMGGSSQGREAGRDRHYGIYLGEVTDNKDSAKKDYRVKVKCYSIHGDSDATFWAKVATPMAGNDTGFHCLPEVGDTVLVAFEAGDSSLPDSAYVIGSVWNGQNKALQKVEVCPTKHTSLDLPNDTQSGKNDIRMWRTRSGQQIAIGDKDGEGFISIRTAAKAELHLDDKTGDIRLYDKDNSQWLYVDVENKKITLQTDTGEILIKAKTKITLDCEDFILKASKSIKAESGTTTEHKAGSTWKQESSGTMDLKAGGTLTAKGGPKIDLNP